MKVVIVKVIILAIAIVAAVTGCGPSGTKIEDVISPKKSCPLDMTVENQGTETLTMDASLSEKSSDAGCGIPRFAADKKTVEPGTTGQLHVELKCRQCSLHKFYSVRSPTNKDATLYDQSMGSPNVFCSTTVCVGR